MNQTLLFVCNSILLGYIGGKMIYDSVKNKGDSSEKPKAGFGALPVQGVATSIDSLSVGFTIADYGFGMALTAASIIAVVTFLLCFGGLCIGKKFGTKIAGKAGILGGTVLLLIGLEIFNKSFL